MANLDMAISFFDVSATSIFDREMKKRKRILCCLCGLFNKNCRVTPTILEVANENDSDPAGL